MANPGEEIKKGLGEAATKFVEGNKETMKQTGSWLAGKAKAAGQYVNEKAEEAKKVYKGVTAPAAPAEAPKDASVQDPELEKKMAAYAAERERKKLEEKSRQKQQSAPKG